MSTATIPEVVAAYFAATRAMDVEAWLSNMAENVTLHDPSAPPLQGHDALRQFFHAVIDAFAKVGLNEDFVAVVGNEAAIKWTGQGLTQNGHELTFEGIDLMEINEAGKIQTIRTYWDPETLITELEEG
jgi:steroid delta-isomerase